MKLVGPDQSFEVPDGLDELRSELGLIVAMIATTARWIHPETFRALPLWYPEYARGLPNYDVNWSRQYTNKDRETGAVVDKKEPNIKAGKAFVAALGIKRKPRNWTVCHIWGVDDGAFQKSNTVVRDRRFYSCVANMVWLPTPLKGFTDSVPEIKAMLRACSFHLYGWVCEHPDVAREASEVRTGHLPAGYPEHWPTSERKILPPGTAPFSSTVRDAIARRKATIRRDLNNSSLRHYPRDEVSAVLRFWKIDIEST